MCVVVGRNVGCVYDKEVYMFVVVWAKVRDVYDNNVGMCVLCVRKCVMCVMYVVCGSV